MAFIEHLRKSPLVTEPLLGAEAAALVVQLRMSAERAPSARKTRPAPVEHTASPSMPKTLQPVNSVKQTARSKKTKKEPEWMSFEAKDTSPNSNTDTIDEIQRYKMLQGSVRHSPAVLDSTKVAQDERRGIEPELKSSYSQNQDFFKAEIKTLNTIATSNTVIANQGYSNTEFDKSKAHVALNTGSLHQNFFNHEPIQAGNYIPAANQMQNLGTSRFERLFNQFDQDTAVSDYTHNNTFDNATQYPTPQFYRNVQVPQQFFHSQNQYIGQEQYGHANSPYVADNYANQERNYYHHHSQNVPLHHKPNNIVPSNEDKEGMDRIMSLLKSTSVIYILISR